MAYCSLDIDNDTHVNRTHAWLQPAAVLLLLSSAVCPLHLQQQACELPGVAAAADCAAVGHAGQLQTVPAPLQPSVPLAEPLAAGGMPALDPV